MSQDIGRPGNIVQPGGSSWRNVSLDVRLSGPGYKRTFGCDVIYVRLGPEADIRCTQALA